jgi:hypothetical protein
MPASKADRYAAMARNIVDHHLRKPATAFGMLDLARKIEAGEIQKELIQAITAAFLKIDAEVMAEHRII